MQINASQVQNVLRTYQHLVKSGAGSSNEEGESDKKSSVVDRVTLSKESIKRLGEEGLRAKPASEEGSESES